MQADNRNTSAPGTMPGTAGVQCSNKEPIAKENFLCRFVRFPIGNRVCFRLVKFSGVYRKCHKAF